MGQVPFPQDSPNWPLVRHLLSQLQERLLSETINAQDTAMHIQVLYEACQAALPVDVGWIQREQGTGSGGARQKLDQSYLWFGMLKFLKKAEQEERDKFLFTTLPNIIQLALRLDHHSPPQPLHFSQQQKGGKTRLSRQFIASILACSFLCLFPERVRDKTSKLNVINFTNFFKHLPQPSQIAKLRCFLHYFERTVEAALERQGSITFHRQVADRSLLPTLEELKRCQVTLCPIAVHPEGAVEDVGSLAMQVNFANRSIGGDVLGKGRVQEEIRFSTCPELVAAMLFMENMEDNEAIVICGFEQFSACTGYASSLNFAEPFYDKAERDSSGNLQNIVCAIDATSFRWGSGHQQYQDAFLLREIHKAIVGFSVMEDQQCVGLPTVEDQQCVEPLAVEDQQCVELLAVEDQQCVELLTVEDQQCVELPSVEDGYVTTMHSIHQERVEIGQVEHFGKELAREVLRLALLEAVGTLWEDRLATEDGDQIHLHDLSLLSLSSDNPAVGQSSSTPRDEVRAQVPREESRSEAGHGHSFGGNGERLSLPVVIPRPQNGSCDLLEVDYTEWLANFRRRSSQLSDLTSRRSSSSTKHSSEFSSDLEEIYETLVQAEKAQHGIIEEENYGVALSDYAAHFVTSVVSEGTSVAAQMLPGMKEFQQGKPPSGIVKPQVVRPTTVHFSGDSGCSGSIPWTEEADSDLRNDTNPRRAGEDTAHLTQSQVPAAVQAYVDSLVDREMRGGLTDASAVLHKQHSHDQSDYIPDDVYRWFADKIVQEVFAHVVDELYFQRFTWDSRWRADLPVNREGVEHKQDQSDSDSLSSSSSSMEASRANCDGQRVAADSYYVDSPRGHTTGSSEAGIASPRNDGTDQRKVNRKVYRKRVQSQSSVSEGVEPKERRDERKSVTFTVEGDERWQEVSASGMADPIRDTSHTAGRLSGTQNVHTSTKSCESRVGQRFLVRDIPVPFSTVRPVTSPASHSRSVKEVVSSRSELSKSASSGTGSSGADDFGVGDGLGRVAPGTALTGGREAGKSRLPLLTSTGSGIVADVCMRTDRSQPLTSTTCVTTDQPAKSTPPPSANLPFKDPAIHSTVPLSSSPRLQQASVHEGNASSVPLASAVPLLSSPRLQQASVHEGSASSVPLASAVPLLSSPRLQQPLVHEGSTSSVPSSPASTFHCTPSSGQSSATITTLPSYQRTHAMFNAGSMSEQGTFTAVSSQDLNLDCYRAAAAIVNQVFQSIPDHLTEAELQSLRGNSSSFYYHGRKYESIFPRGSYETAAAVIGASEKGNVVSDNYMQNRTVTGISTSEMSSSRRTRSQSPCFSWLSKRLSRETLTNAFVKVESRPSVKAYERRSSEPCQRSVTLSLQAFSTSRCYGYGGDRSEDKLRNNAHTDDDLDKVKADCWRRGSLDSISLSRRRSSCGFKDPVLSRFAQELITADTSVPQLVLVDSGSTTSTTGSRRSSMSGFRDTTLATFESELLNSSFTLSQAATSPRHRRPKRSHSRESRLWKSDSSETEYWFPIPRRVGQEFQEQMERVHRHYSVDEIEDFADFVATTILQQAVSILYHDAQEMRPEDEDINIFSENLADQIMREALVASAKITSASRSWAKHRSRRVGQAKSVSDSELDFSVSSNDLTARSLEDRLTDFQDAMDVSLSGLEVYAGSLAEQILATVYEELGATTGTTQSLVPGGRAIATGNWGCGSLCGDPCVKLALQWMAASVAECPHLSYFTFGDNRLQQLPAVVEMLFGQQWTVGQLMEAVTAYCHLVLREAEACGADEGGPSTVCHGGRDREGVFHPSHTLFDFLLSQP